MTVVGTTTLTVTGPPAPDPGVSWVLTDEGSLITTSVGSELVGNSIQTRNKVKAIQFATSQNTPVQLIPDDDFTDPTLVDYDWSDTARWHKIGDATLLYVPEIDSVKVIRHIVPPVRIAFGSLVQPIVQPVYFGRDIDLALAAEDSGQIGGIESPGVDLASEGVIHAVARIRLEHDLTEPVLLQVLTNNDDEDLLVEKELFGRAGQTIEEYVSYVIGSLTPPPAPIVTWTPQRSAIINRPVHLPFSTEETLTSEVVTPPPPIDDSSVKVRLVQIRKTGDSWTLDTLSLFDEGIIWEFTVNGGTDWYPAYGIRNNAYGMLVFPEPGTSLRYRARSTQPNTSISGVQLRPIYNGVHNARLVGVHRGPNVSDYDHFPPIEDDPEFNTWTKPIPRSWYALR